MHRVLVFDDGLGLLAPLTDLRAAFEVRTGALTTIERLRATLPGPVFGLFVPDALRTLTRPRHSEPVNTLPAGDAPILLVSGRSPTVPAGLSTLAPGQSILEQGTGDVVAACVTPKVAISFLQGGTLAATPVRELPAPALLSRPWHIRAFRDEALAADLALLARPAPGTGDPASVPALFEVPDESRAHVGRGALIIGGFPITVAPTARVYEGAILDAERGPIVIAAHATVRPGAIIVGPCYVGPHANVLERATLRPGTAVGPACKVNGEIGGSIFQGFANKAHDGYLGDSYVGEWANLGAGTTTSNLLNTYDDIIARATPDGKHERTGQQFLGAILGDHVKTAICTRLGTGCVLHTGGMFATSAAVTGCSPRFAWATDEGVRRYRLDKFIAVARTVMARRKIEPSEAYMARLAALHAMGE